MGYLNLSFDTNTVVDNNILMLCTNELKSLFFLRLGNSQRIKKLGKNKGGLARDLLSSFFFRRKTVQQKLLGFGKSSVNTGKDTLGGVCCSGNGFNAFGAVLLNDFRDHVVDRGLNDHVGFSVFEDLNIGNLAAFDNDGNIDLTVVTIALTFVCAVFVGSRSSGHQAEAGEQENEFFHRI